MAGMEGGFSEQELNNTSKRTESDADLIRGGSHYVNSESGPRLEVSDKQIADIDRNHKLEKEIQDRLPVGEEFEIVAESNQSSRYSGQYARVGLTGRVESPDILLVGRQRLRITNISEGMNGKVVTVEAAQGDSKRYFYTDVLASDKSQRLPSQEAENFLK
jgi:hypothetical protein